jgi:hypothetical protein
MVGSVTGVSTPPMMVARSGGKVEGMDTMMLVHFIGSAVIALWTLTFKERPPVLPSAAAKKHAQVGVARVGHRWLIGFADSHVI